MNTKYTDAKSIFDLGYYFHRISDKTDFLGNDRMAIQTGLDLNFTRKAMFKTRLVYFYGLWNQFYEKIKKIALSKNLEDNIESLGGLLKEAVDQKKRKFTKYYEKQIIDDVKIFISLIESDLNSLLEQITIIPIPENTNLNKEKLLNGANSFFESSTWSKMTNIQKEDLQDSCSCLCLHQWTPSAMIVMRSIEAAVREYYQRLTKINSASSIMPITSEKKTAQEKRLVNTH